MSERKPLNWSNCAPFTEAEMTREPLALEEAVRRVEDEAVQRASDAHVPAIMSPSSAIW